MKTERGAYGLLVFSRQLQHRRIEVNADNLAFGANNLGNEVTGLAAARPQVEDCFASTDVARRVAAAVIFP